MQVDYALILGAGLGTRMGDIVKKIPKILWPVYFKTMLELQIRYCEELNINKIYLNTHYLHGEIVDFLKRTKLANRVTVLHEAELLDSGGAIHNLASRPEINYKGNLLLVNGDQFLFFEKKYWQEAKMRIASSRAVLFGITVDKNSNYNETIIENNQLIQIKKNENVKDRYITYSGLGILNLNGLAAVSGISRFFETVANYRNEKVNFVTPEAFEYWDFGKADIYAENIFKLATSTGRESLMGNFLKLSLAFDGDQDLYVNLANKSLDLDYLGRFEPGSISANSFCQKI